MNEVTTTNQALFTTLREIGLTETEATLYVSSLAYGPATVATLAKRLNIPRPNVYRLIASLEEYGLTEFSKRMRHARTFTVAPPTAVLELLRQKREEIKRLDHSLVGTMPDLLAMYAQGDVPTKVRVYTGKEQWLELFFQILEETKSEIRFCGSADAFIEFVSWKTEREWIKRRVEKKIHMNVLLVPGKDQQSLSAEDDFEMRTTRVLNTRKPFATGFMLYANKVIIWQPKAPLALLVEDEYIVEMQSALWETLWNTSA